MDVNRWQLGLTYQRRDVSYTALLRGCASPFGDVFSKPIPCEPVKGKGRPDAHARKRP
jgi:hypothetical protein